MNLILELSVCLTWSSGKVFLLSTDICSRYYTSCHKCREHGPNKRAPIQQNVTSWVKVRVLELPTLVFFFFFSNPFFFQDQLSCHGLEFHFLPFFFFLPPADGAACPPCCTGVPAPLPRLPSSSTALLLTGGASGMGSSGHSAGKPAMQRPSRARATCTRRVTSAAFVVRYLRLTPVTGS